MSYRLSYLQWSRYDDVIEKLLETMELEDKLTLRLVYITSLLLLLDAARLRMCCWSKQLMHVCGCYLEVAGYSQGKQACHTLQVREFELNVT
jgi:hypothetical protein